MDRVLLIDGVNFKNKLKLILRNSHKNRIIWNQYDFKGLLDKVFGNLLIDRKTFYFAKVKEHRDSKEKSKQLIEEQRLLKTHLENQGFDVVLSGRVRGQLGSENGRSALIFREKGVDVKIAVDMVCLACDKKAKEIIIGSSDSDLQPAIREVKDRHVHCSYLGFEFQPNKGISFTVNKTILINDLDALAFYRV